MCFPWLNTMDNSEIFSCNSVFFVVKKVVNENLGHPVS